MEKIYFASQNQHKIQEISQVLPPEIKVISIAEIGQVEELSETGSTLKENALQKARFVYEKFKVNCFADDTGLEVAALNGAPGVYSARYAGTQRNALDNMNKLLADLNGITDRKACFKTVIALILDGKEYLFEGILYGSILTEPKGANGFGYDPIFVPENQKLSFAEMESEAKNRISHRALAVKKLVEFLQK